MGLRWQCKWCGAKNETPIWNKGVYHIRCRTCGATHKVTVQVSDPELIYWDNLVITQVYSKGELSRVLT